MRTRARILRQIDPQEDKQTAKTRSGAKTGLWNRFYDRPPGNTGTCCVPLSLFPVCIFTCRYKINPGVIYVAVIPPRRMFSCFISVLLYILCRFHLEAIKSVHLANRARVSTTHSSDVLLIYGVLARIATLVIFVLDTAVHISSRDKSRDLLDDRMRMPRNSDEITFGQYTLPRRINEPFNLKFCLSINKSASSLLFLKMMIGYITVR